MLGTRVIACLDVREGRVVKGVNFVNLTDEGDPVELAARYAAEGIDEIVYLDIAASPQGRSALLDVVRRTARNVFVPLTVGGGVRSADDMRAVLRAGADKVSFNTAAVLRPSLIAECAAAFGSQCVVLAVDGRAAEGGWNVFINGGRRDAGRDAVEWAAEGARRGAGEILLTSMDRDGTHLGFDIPLTKAVTEAVDVPVIASGGAGRPYHFTEAVTEANASAVLAAGIFHRGQVSIAAVKQEMSDAGVPVRMVRPRAAGAGRRPA